MWCIGLDSIGIVVQTVVEEKLQQSAHVVATEVGSEVVEQLHKQAVHPDENTINKFLLRQLQSSFADFRIEGECSSQVTYSRFSLS